MTLQWRLFWVVSSLFCVAASGANLARAAEKPNFVWIVSEDNSKHYLRLFDPAGAPAPNIEALAQNGLVFEHAFSNAPVCSTARTTLATCLYGPRIGTQYHRKFQPASLAPGWRMFPYYLRQAGYYTTNNAKKDYNAVEGNGVWDASSKRATWRHRPSPDTPFFHMHSYAASHESSLHFTKEQIDFASLQTDPQTVQIAPYHPDTPLFRYTYARYHDRMRKVDQFVGKIVRQLKEDGLLEDTFVFYFGDHGGVLPRSKGYLYETGLHVPLVVRIPKKWQHLVGIPRGTRVEGFVSFIDFGATVLHLAGVPVPKHFDGRPFLGPGVSLEDINRRNQTYGYADRFDEKYDLCRSLRVGRFKYIRNYQAFYPDSLQNNYRYRMLAYQQWRQMYRDGKLNAVQRQFFEPKPVEALFDIESDPYEVRNLAADPAYATVLQQMRQRMQHWVKNLPDLSFFPECELVKRGLDDPVRFGRAHADQIARLVDVADLSLRPFAKAKADLEAAMQSSDRWERYWAWIACSCFGRRARDLVPAARKALDDTEPLVRVRAAEFLAIVGATDPRPVLYDTLNATDDPAVATLILNTAVFVNDHLKGYPFDVSRLHMKLKGGYVERRLSHLAGREKQ
ncbi:MAG: sulfatase-like hydrolase/transferase [Planctomycetes bacterium]|nr:sulfatase-like hydrolase/transferase [Planctomycetota bacterium]